MFSRLCSIINYIKQDFVYWYTKFAPQYGYFWSIEYSLFNSIYFRRDLVWRHNTRGELNQ
jgi:hypothetical protein